MTAQPFSVVHCPVSPPIAIMLERGIGDFLLLNHSPGEEEPSWVIAGVYQTVCRGTQREEPVDGPAVIGAAI